MSVTMTAPGGSITMQTNPEYADSSLQLFQPANRTSGGVTIPADYLADSDVQNLRWPRASRADRDLLEDFFWNKAHGMTVPFSYIDQRGTVTTRRFAVPEVSVESQSTDVYTISLSTVIL
jgi:hypothetical protein